MKLSIYRLVLGVSAAALVPAAASASLTVNINQVGSNVVANGSGSLNLRGLADQGGGWILTESVWGAVGYVALGDAGTVHGYSGFTGPATFGSGSSFSSSTFSGTDFALNASEGNEPYLWVPEGYSGGAISDTASWLGQSLASLGLTPGSYVYTLPEDTVTVNIGRGVGGVPEPATWAMMLLGFGAIGWTVRRKSRTVGSLQVT